MFLFSSLPQVKTIFSTLSNQNSQLPTDDQPNTFKTENKTNFKILTQARVKQITIQNKIYQINHLVENVNLNLVGSWMLDDAKTQLAIVI